MTTDVELLIKALSNELSSEEQKRTRKKKKKNKEATLLLDKSINKDIN